MDLRELGARIYRCYQRAYGAKGALPASLSTTVIYELGPDVQDSGATRAFIKHFMAALDARYGPPSV